MKLLIIQEAGRHERNRGYREALSLARALEQRGVQTIVWGLGYPLFSQPFEQISAGCDAVLTLENYDSGWHPDLNACRLPKLFWSIDSHCALAAHQAFCKRHKIDVLLNSTRRYLDSFRGLVGSAAWFPNAIDAELIRAPADSQKLHDVGFCGSMIAGRAAWLEGLSRSLPIRRDAGALGPDMVAAVASYRIGLNRCIADDINYRVFEVPACGALLLTNRVLDLEALLTPEREIAVYDSDAELIDRCRHYLEHPAALEAVCRAGTAAVLARHTYANRAEQLQALLESAGAGHSN